MAYIREWGGQFVIPIPEVRGISLKRSKRTKRTSER
jgi:hypothetical protein